MLTKGYEATKVDEVCRAAGLTKGAFFHYFANKEALGESVLEQWDRDGFASYQNAPFFSEEAPLDRALGYVDFTAMLLRSAPQKGCMIGTFTQETAHTHPRFRERCASSFQRWADGVRDLIEDAGSADADIDAATLGQLFVSVYEGALILAKAYDRPEIVDEHLELYKRLLLCLLDGRDPAPVRRTNPSEPD